MADQDAKSLEDRLKLAFDCSVLCSLDENKTALMQDKRKGVELYLKENYEDAKSCFLSAIEKCDSGMEKAELYRKALDCSREIFKKFLKGRNEDKKEEEFKEVCSLYQRLIHTEGKPDSYLGYMEFLGTEMIDEHRIHMLDEAIRVGEIAAETFPEDARIHASLHGLYSGIGQGTKAYSSMISACKLKFDDPNFIISNFGTEILASAPNNTTPSTVPLVIMMKYKNRAILKSSELLYRYGDYTLRTKGRPTLAVTLLRHAYGLNPRMHGLKEKVAEAYEQAIGSITDAEKKYALEKDLEDFCQKTGIARLTCESEDNEKLPELKLLPAATIIKKAKNEEMIIPHAKDIKKYLDEYVIGQENAKIILTVGLRNHLKRVKHNREHPNERMEKDNILLLGPTGCGKTLTARVLAEKAGLPFAEFDANTITAHGYVGKDAEDCITRLYFAAGCNIQKTEMGFIFLDEVDKIAANDSHSGADVNGSGAQNALMKILEGCKVEIAVADKEGQKHLVNIDTRDILFILGGAFSGKPGKDSLSYITDQREGNRGIGFKTGNNKKKKNTIMAVTDSDIQKYGFLPELCGRVPLRALLDPLSKEQLKRVLVEPKNSLLSQKKQNFALDGIELIVDEDALDIIAEKASELNSGARSLRTILNTVFLIPEFELPGTSVKTLRVDKEYVQKAIEGIEFKE